MLQGPASDTTQPICSRRTRHVQTLHGRRLAAEPLEDRNMLAAMSLAEADLTFARETPMGPAASLPVAEFARPNTGPSSHSEPDISFRPILSEGYIYVPEGKDPIPVPEPRFVTTGTKWSQPGGLGSPATITYSYSNLLDGGLPGNLSANEIRALTEEALGEWAAVAPLNFVEQVDAGPPPSDAGYSASGRPMLRFGHHFIDGSSGQNTLAHAFFPGSGGLNGDIHFDNSNTWGDRDIGSTIDFLEVMTHELGHALGLGHEDDVNAIMNSFYAGIYNGPGTAFLFQDDINGIRAVYGTGVGSVSPLPSDDNYEPNDTLATAADPLSNGGNWNQRLLSTINGLAVQSDDDWYEINVVQDFQRLTIDAFFSDAAGDIDVALFDAAGNLLAEATSNSDDEQLEYVVGSPGAYFIRVSGEDAGNTYDLAWNRDFSVPLVESMVAAPTADPLVYEFTVTFTDDVRGVDTSDFQLATTGSVTGNIASVAAVSRDVYVVTVDNVTGLGTLQLELIDDDSITGNLPPAATFVGYDTLLSLVVNSNGTFELLAEVDPTVGGGLAGINIDLVNIDSAINLAPRLTVSGILARGFTVGLEDLTGDGPLFAGQNLINSGTLIYGIGQAAGGTVPDGFDSVNIPWDNPLTLATGTWSGAAPLLGASTNATLFTSVGASTAIEAAESSQLANVTPLGGVGVDNGNAQSNLVDLSPPPLVASITAATTADPSVVEFTVTFTEDVRGVDVGDFALQTSGTVSATLASVTRLAGDVFLVTAENVSGLGTLRLDLIDNDSIFGRIPDAAVFTDFDTQLSLLINPAGTFELVAEVDPSVGGGLAGINIDLVNIDSALNLAPRLVVAGFAASGFTVGLADLTGDGPLFAGQNLINAGTLIYGVGQGAGGVVPDGFESINVPWDDFVTLAAGTFSGANPELGASQNATLFTSVGANTAISAEVQARSADVIPLGAQGLLNGDFEGDVLVIAPPGDFDLDGDVDGEDFLLWQAGFGATSGATIGDGDADGDGDVDGDDFLVWQANFGSFPPAGNGAAASVTPVAPSVQVPRTAPFTLAAALENDAISRDVDLRPSVLPRVMPAVEESILRSAPRFGQLRDRATADTEFADLSRGAAHDRAIVEFTRTDRVKLRQAASERIAMDAIHDPIVVDLAATRIRREHVATRGGGRVGLARR